MTSPTEKFASPAEKFSAYTTEEIIGQLHQQALDSPVLEFMALMEEAAKRLSYPPIQVAVRGPASYDEIDLLRKSWIGMTGNYKAVDTLIVEPLPILLHCPMCHERHIDEGEFARKPHHTHACQHCGHVWRPAITPTVGIRFLPGFKNEEGGSK